MLFAISKRVRGRAIWLEDVVPAPKWSIHQDALCFHSDMDARITLKFLPRPERRGAAVIRWSESSGGPLIAKLDDHPFDLGIRTIADIPVFRESDLASRAPIAIPAAALGIVDECLHQDAGEPLQ